MSFILKLSKPVTKLEHRSKAEIISQILEVAKLDLNGIGKTKIMYFTNLSFAQSKEYLQLVLDRELLEYDKAGKRYRLTQKGVEYLEMFRKTKSIIDT